ncbi:TIGR04222 domain-containing membrane protein [Streptomyces platensis]|uniref:TIGR04222 domain-containing membrane protein n=1 Tax=Streptomyces platensis TaxID=58346 RepID=UPI003322B7BC
MSYPQAVYAGLAASSLLLIVGTISVRLRTPSVPRADALAHDVWETAFLAGGPGRVVDAALAGMHEDGRLAVGGPGVVTVRRALARDAVEAAVLDAIARTPGGALAALRATAMRSPAVQAVGDGLAARGLLRRPQLGRGWRRWAGVQMTVCGVLFFVGVLLAVTGSGGFAVPPVVTTAPALIGGLIVASVCRKACTRRITKAGSFALHTAKVTHASAGGGGVWQPAGLVVALGGTALIADELLRQQFEEAQRAAAGSGSAASGSSAADTSGGGSGSDGGSWCGSSGGGSGCGSGGSSCGGGASCGGGSSCGSGSSCGGGGCGGG